MDVACQVCGNPFPAKRASARYCTERCKKRAQRSPGGIPPVVALVAPVVPLAGQRVPVTGQDGGGLWSAVHAELVEAGRLNSPDGQAALALARIVDSPDMNTASAVAAAVRECRAALTAALKGAAVAETPLQAMRRKRAERLEQPAS